MSKSDKPWILHLTVVVFLFGCGGGSSPTSCPQGSESCNGACVNILTDPTNCGGCGNICPAGDGCMAGACTTACTNPCGSTCCDSSQVCTSGVCCSSTQACGSMCCGSGQVCAADASGAMACRLMCTAGTDCPASTPCCSVLDNAAGVPITAYGACYASGSQCRCNHMSECSTGACAPLTDASGNPTPIYICKPNDQAPYDGCNCTFCSCGGASCCVVDSNGNYFCANPCMNDSMCGAAHCDSFDFSHSSCSGPLACGP